VTCSNHDRLTFYYDGCDVKESNGLANTMKGLSQVSLIGRVGGTSAISLVCMVGMASSHPRITSGFSRP
jgi:hypothetical protein